jgi:hypothetical protein
MLIGRYAGDGVSLEVLYTASENVPGADATWDTDFPEVSGTQKVWMKQKLSNAETYSSPV